MVTDQATHGTPCRDRGRGGEGSGASGVCRAPLSRLGYRMILAVRACAALVSRREASRPRSPIFSTVLAGQNLDDHSLLDARSLRWQRRR